MNKRIKYVVSVSYNDFVFYDANEAVNFAILAKTRFIDERDSDKEVKVEIEICVENVQDVDSVVDANAVEVTEEV